ncbi:MAG: cation:proton antiporter [Bacillota bacterium]
MLVNLGIIFVLASLAILAAKKIKYCSIPLLILLGIFLGPNAPQFSWMDLSLIKNSESVELFSRLGVLFLLFYLGLEFSIGQVVQNSKLIVKGGSIFTGLNFFRGLALGWVFFHSWPCALIVAGITTVSSSAIITKLLVETKRTANPETELILGIMVYEDIFMAFFLSILSGYLLSQGSSLLVSVTGGLAALSFIMVVFFLGRRLGIVLDRLLNKPSVEALVVVTFTLLLLSAVLAETLRVSEAVGALLLGLILAETAQVKKLVQMFTPFRDLFGAVFFLSFGMQIDYHHFLTVLDITAWAVILTVAGNLLAGWLSALACGYRGAAAANIACSIVARGEFAIIVAGLAASAGMSGAFQPFAALYVLILALLSPLLMKRSKSLYNFFIRLRKLSRKTKNILTGA